MRPAPFEYVVPGTVAQVCAELSADPVGARILAGGQSLVPLLIRRQDRPRRVVDITRIAELRDLTVTEDQLSIGAAVTQRAVETYAATAGFGVLAQALPWVGKVTTRNRGTVCGSLANANPAAELGVCLLVLGGEVTAVSTRGTRQIAAPDFFLAPRRTALATDELLHTVRFHRPAAGTVGHFDEVTVRGPGDTPLVSVAASARGTAAGIVDVRIAVGAEGRAPVAAPTAVTADLAGALDDGAVDRAGRWVAELEFGSDSRAGAEHRRRLAINLVTRLARRLREDLT